jgi:hypothetical protein
VSHTKFIFMIAKTEPAVNWQNGALGACHNGVDLRISRKTVQIRERTTAKIYPRAATFPVLPNSVPKFLPLLVAQPGVLRET